MTHRGPGTTGRLDPWTVLVGIITRSDPPKGRTRHLREENERERVLHTGIAVLRGRCFNSK